MSSSAQLGSAMLGALVLGGESPDDYTVEEALRRLLMDLTGLTNVFYMRRPQGNQYPAVVFEKDGEEERSFTLDGAKADVATYSFRIIVATTDPADMTRIAKAIEGTEEAPGLDGFAGMMLGREVTFAWKDGGDTDAAERSEDDSDCWYYGRAAGYQLNVKD
jgi:hypothetical protein